MSLNDLQFKFCKDLPLLMNEIISQGYTFTPGSWLAKAEDGRHKINSLHYIGLAIDINLFLDGKYLTKTEDHRQFGLFWQSLDPYNRWGGLYNDGNHYERVPHKWR